MTAFEKSLRSLNEETLRAGAEELLSLLTQAPGIRRGRGGPGDSGGRKYGGVAAFASAGGVSPERGNGVETETEIAIDGPAPGEETPETTRARRRANTETYGGDPAAEEAVRDAAPPGQGFSEVAEREDQEDRKTQRDREAEDDREDPKKPKSRTDLKDRENRERREDRKNREERREREDRGTLENRGDRNGRDSREDRARMLHVQDETVDRVEIQALERRLQSVGGQRRGSLRQSGEDEDSGVYTAAFRGPERHYEGAIGARGTEMSRISEFFRRDSRRYDTGFTRY